MENIETISKPAVTDKSVMIDMSAYKLPKEVEASKILEASPRKIKENGFDILGSERLLEKSLRIEIKNIPKFC